RQLRDAGRVIDEQRVEGAGSVGNGLLCLGAEQFHVREIAQDFGLHSGFGQIVGDGDEEGFTHNDKSVKRKQPSALRRRRTAGKELSCHGIEISCDCGPAACPGRAACARSCGTGPCGAHPSSSGWTSSPSWTS